LTMKRAQIDEKSNEGESIKRAAREKNVFDNEKSHYINIQGAFDSSDSGRYNDVEFTLSDGSKLRANKFILATQSDYFDTMFYGSLKHGKVVPLKWCSKTTMEKVLAFLSVGKVDIGDLEIMELLELMEAARLMCVENLFNFVEAYVEQFVGSSSGYWIFNEMTMPPVQALMALDFALVKHLESVTNWLLKFIDRNIKNFMKVGPEEAGVLSVNGMTILLEYEGTAKRIDLLAFFIVWKEAVEYSGIEISQYVKLEELNAQELKLARTSNLYSLSEITDKLERIVAECGTTINETKVTVRNLKKMIEEKDYEIEDKDSEIKDKDYEIKDKDYEIKEKDDEIEEKNCEIENLNFKVKNLAKYIKIEKKNSEIKNLKKCLAELYDL